ncbi:MAG: MarR family transcriptional regulator [Polyangiaceae bacterium]
MRRTPITPAPAPLDAHLGYWLRRVSNQVSGAFARALQQEQVSVAEWVALRLIYGEEARTSGALASVTGMSRGAVSKVVDKLEQKGLLARLTDSNDQRVQQLSLTRRGTRCVPKLAALADHNDAHFFGCLSVRERAQLLGLLAKLTDVHQLRDVPLT